MTDHGITDVSALSGSWRKSSYSGNESGSCVEVLDGYPFGVPVRDSKLANSPALVITAAGWNSFIHAVKKGHGSSPDSSEDALAFQVEEESDSCGAGQR